MASHGMGGTKKPGPIVSRMIGLKVGQSCFIVKGLGLSQYYATARKTLPGAQWRSEAREGGYIVTRTA